MSPIEELHEQAMDLAEEAFLASRQGNDGEAKRLFLAALEVERKAASSLPLEPESEPTRSILYRSSAALAYHAKDYEQAEQLVARGLSGYPPQEIKDELYALQDDANFRRHISLRGVNLGENRMVMTLWGNAIAYGVIAADQLVRRVSQISTVFYRTVERLFGMPYRTAGGPRKPIADRYQLFVEGLPASSFGVSFSIGAPAEQLELPGMPGRPEPEQIIDEVMSCFEMLQGSEFQALQERFGNETYFQNFVSVARQMAPDGDSIKGVGLATYHNGQERIVGVRKRRNEIPTPAQLLPEEKGKGARDRTPVRLTGLLKVADNLRVRRERGMVQLSEKTGKVHTILVPVSQMQDVVQPYFDELVVVTGYRIGRYVYLEDIEQAHEDEGPTTDESEHEDSEALDPDGTG